MKKFLLFGILITILTALLLLASDGQAQSDKVYKLRFASPFQEMEPPGVTSNYFMDYVEKKAGGRS